MTEQATPPTPPQQGAPVPPVEAGAPVAPAKKGAGKKIAGIVGVVLVVLVGALVKFGISAFVNQDETADAKSGDCLSGQTAEDMKIVSCDEGTAAHKVVGKLENKTEAETDADDTCTEYPTAETFLWKGKEGGTGYILCLEPAKK
ncbi:LppU/SCO3897 family protein [Micromonospora sp. NPDC003197]